MSAAPQQEEPRRTGGRVAWLAAAAVASLVLAVVVSLVGLGLSRSAAVQARYDKVEVGVTTIREVDLLDPSMVSVSCPLGSRTMSWTFDRYVITVEFDDDGVVRGKAIRPRSRHFAERVKSLWDALWPI
jgi:hypothetical protein